MNRHSVPLFVRAAPAGTLAHFLALRGFAQNLAVMLALPGLGRTVGAAGVRPPLAGIAALLLLTAACRYRSDAQPHHCA